jgi:hypothetical protein
MAMLDPLIRVDPPHRPNWRSAPTTALGYSETITVAPLTKRFGPYCVPSDELGSILLKKVFGR